MQAISMIRRMKRRAFLSVCTQRSPLIVFTLMYVKEELEKLGFVQSMSRKGEPHDNAVAENFFSCLKCELVYLTSYATRRQAQNSIFRYIEGFYNPVRPHSSIGWLSPMEYARQLKRRIAPVFLSILLTMVQCIVHLQFVYASITKPLDNIAMLC